ncbi:hypothetical protein M1L60_02060 [Actinoplanes sp. TRM 88003]|uniref:TIGR02569 family protein n=1 Tax=Paractinoplanes aksuensis TaxID=2939490 RepID=A0ABT1DEZ9_9ACTN|nr:hypothetical protein [Actinoplanes aksuensis]MCO8269370.1 hypothetical protein [Actinoplanes aksuensis]
MLRDFGVEGVGRALDGGQGTSWLVGGLVFKPEVPAVVEGLDRIREDGFRLAAPCRTREGSFESHGWSATRWVAGCSPDGAWRDVVEAGRAFHRAVAGIARPAFVDERQDWWARGDRVAWGERDVVFRAEFAGVADRLAEGLEPLGASQLVHADLTQNVLLAPVLPPAIIDISPYWRPVAYAEGVVVADAVCWHGADASLLELVGVSVPAVARALMFRMATTNERDDLPDVWDEARRYERAAAAIGL